MEKANNVNENRDELDLLSLVEGSISFFKTFGKIIIIFAIAGLLLGALKYSISPKEYSSTLILHSFIINNPEQLQIVRTWNELLKKKEYGILAQTFNCDPGILTKVGKISAEEIQKLYVADNSTGFSVHVLIKDIEILDELQKALVFGLQNSEYVKERIAVKKSNLNRLIQKVTNEISSLDSMKSKVENSINNRNQNQSGFILDVTGVNTQLIALHEKLYSYQEDLRFVNAVQVLQNFDKIRKPEKPKLLSSLAFGLIAGIFIGYFIALYRYVKRKLKKRANTPTRPVEL